MVWVVSVAIAIVMAELCILAAHQVRCNALRLWPQIQLLRLNLKALQTNMDDDGKQRLLIESGIVTLKLSCIVLCFISLLTVIALLPFCALQWTAAQQQTYFVATSLIAVVWWMSRRHLSKR